MGAVTVGYSCRGCSKIKYGAFWAFGRFSPCPKRALCRGALEGKGPQRRPRKRLEEVADGVGGGYCRLSMSLRLALGVRETVAGHRLGALEGGGEGGTSLPFNALLALWAHGLPLVGGPGEAPHTSWAPGGPGRTSSVLMR